MGLILCENKKAVHPFYIEALNIHIYSIEELCYVIYEYPLLYEDMDQPALKAFIENELDIHLHPSVDDLLSGILDHSDYYSSQEVQKYREKRADLAACSIYMIDKLKGDLMLNTEKYGKAVRQYEYAINEALEAGGDRNFLAECYRNTGFAYANLFEYDKAFRFFAKADSCLNKKTMGKYVYFLSLLDSSIENRKKYLDYLGESPHDEWEREFNEKLEEARSSPEMAKVEKALNTDSVRKWKNIGKIINNWKQLYRNTV